MVTRPGPRPPDAVNPATAPHYPTAALLTIDLQVDVLDEGPLGVAGTSAVVAPAARLAGAFRRVGRPIVHMVRLYAADGSNAEPSRRALVSGATPVLRPGTPGRQLAPGLVDPAPELDDRRLLDGGIQVLGPGEAAIYKPRWGAFFRTPLEGHLAGLGVDTLVVAGCNFPNCPRASIYEASERDLRVVAVADALSGLTDQGRDELGRLGVEVASSDQVVAALG